MLRGSRERALDSVLIGLKAEVGGFWVRMAVMILLVERIVCMNGKEGVSGDGMLWEDATYGILENRSPAIYV